MIGMSGGRSDPGHQIEILTVPFTPGVTLDVVAPVMTTPLLVNVLPPVTAIRV